MSAGGASSHSSGQGAQAVRKLGRFELRELLGRSQRTMAWRVLDPRVDQELLLVLPRNSLPSEEAVKAWEANTRKVSRLGHPGLAHVVEVAAQDRFPYVAYDFEGGTLGSRLAAGSLSPRDAAAAIAQVARALSFAHESDHFHGDLQPYLVCITPAGQVKLAGLEVAVMPATDAPTAAELESQRVGQVGRGVEADLLAMGVMLYSALAGRPVFDEPDVGVAVARMLAGETEPLRLAASVPQPVADPLRAIATRAVERDAGLRYRSSRAFHTAIDGWLKADPNAGDSIFKSVVDKVKSDGLLPGSEQTRERMANLRALEGESTREMSELLLGDLAVALELLRVVNTAQQRDARRAGSTSILTIHKAVALLGLEGVRRSALALKPWPGNLRGAAVDHLASLLDRCRQAARVARLLRPQGYDAESIYMAAVLQNLGRLVLHYHFPEHAQQIRALMTSESSSSQHGTPTGMSEDIAAFSVLGIDIGSVGVAVGRHLGLDAATLTSLKRISVRGAAILPPPRTDEEAFCQTASCANDAIDALQLPPEKAAAELAAIVNRYGRSLRITVKSLRDALVPNGLTQAVAKIWLKSTPGLLVDEDDNW